VHNARFPRLILSVLLIALLSSCQTTLQRPSWASKKGEQPTPSESTIGTQNSTVPAEQATEPHVVAAEPAPVANQPDSVESKALQPEPVIPEPPVSAAVESTISVASEPPAPTQPELTKTTETEPSAPTIAESAPPTLVE